MYFNRRSGTLVLMATFGMSLVIGGCLQDQTAPESHQHESSGPAPTLPGPSTTIAATDHDFIVDWDGVVERKTGGDCGLSCDDSLYTWIDDCSSLLMRFYGNTSKCAMSNPIFDFDTSGLPDGSNITDVHVRIFLEDNEKQTEATQPDEQGCTPPQGESGPGFDVGNFYVEVDTAGGNSSLTPEKTAAFMCSPVDLVGAPGQSGTVFGGGFYDVAIPNNRVSLTKVSRYVFDREQGSVASTDFVTWSIKANTARLIVDYEVPFSACLDGKIVHTNNNCSSCAETYFTDDTSATTAAVLGDGGSGHCSVREQMVIAFDTDELINDHTIASATLTFNVKTNSASCVTTPKIEFLVRNETSCPTSFDSNDFDDCGTYTSLGTMTVSGTGSKIFTIPNAESRINASGITQFVLVDATIFEGFCSPQKQTFTIYTQDHGTESNRPKLKVVYN